MGGGQGMGGGRGLGGARGAGQQELGSREEEIATLKEAARGLRQQLAEIIDRLERLERGE